ncbi:unnamed protein product [Caenorhabditis nigoni]|uniref:Uncharacterized protein n=1 Tax=Caenorhabditis nigoni TaxID=1611254 RepID=A0A2G5UBJ2_9PELO|nr:hypothetical protein B9Z55_015713 [Caenorhabditis nigoni]
MAASWMAWLQILIFLVICAKYLELQYKEMGGHFRVLHEHDVREVSAALQGLQVRPTHLDDSRANRTIILHGLDE